MAPLQALEHDREHSRLATRAATSDLRASLSLAALGAHAAQVEAQPARAGGAAAGRRLQQHKRRADARSKHEQREGRKAKRSKAKSRMADGGKSKPPFWQDGALKAATTSGAARLCLATWRGQLGSGAVPVFAPCAPHNAEARAQTFAVLDAPAAGGGGPPSAKLLQLGGAGDGADGGMCVSALADGVAWQV
jgi:hypothetical protein